MENQYRLNKRMLEAEVIPSSYLYKFSTEVLEPVPYNRKSYLRLRLTPTDETDTTKNTQIHDVTLVTDVDGFVHLHRHSFYEVFPKSDDVVPVSG
jgi:hypothetical protein